MNAEYLPLQQNPIPTAEVRPDPEDAKFLAKEYSTVESGNKLVASRAEGVP